MPFSTIEMKGFGLEITGLDLSQNISIEDKSNLIKLWLEHGLLLFRADNPTADQQVMLAECFGSLQVHPFKKMRWRENNSLMFLSSELDVIPIHFIDGQARRGFIYWHSDLTYVPDINVGSLLRMVKKPNAGGGTSWCDTAAAYEDLPDKMKARIENLSAVHIARNSVDRAWGQPAMEIRKATASEYPDAPASEQSFPPVLHPLVITHEKTGRRSLLLSPLSYVTIQDMPPDEADDLFEELMQHVLQAKYCYHHDWQLGDMILWDNRRTMHCAQGYPPEQRRLVIRATLSDTQTTGKVLNA